MERVLTDRSLNCRDCGVSFVFAADERRRFKVLGWAPPVRCVACRRQQAQARDGVGLHNNLQVRVDVSPSCVACGAAFVVTTREQHFLVEKFGPMAMLPKRCPTCRRARRHADQSREAV